MSDERKSESQRKLDEVVLALEKFTAILKGDTTTVGLLPRMEKLEVAVNGNEKDMGLRNRVNILWVGARIVAGVGCTGLGYLLHPYLTKLVVLLK